MITLHSIKALSRDNYVRKASHRRNYWFDFSKGKLDQYLSKGTQFSIIIYSGLDSPDNFYMIPFNVIAEAFKKEYMTKDKLNRKRWVGTIVNHRLKISNYPNQIDVTKFYSVLDHESIGFKAMITSSQLVKSWEDVIDNLRQFLLIKKDERSFLLDNFSFFSNWYYFPNDDSFAPGKFIGYLNTTIEHYTGMGDGAEAKRGLEKFFTKILKTSSEFQKLREKLIVFGKSLGKEINSQTFEGRGGIFVPRESYTKISVPYTQTIFDVSRADIDSFNDEHYTGFDGQKKEHLVSYYERDTKLRARAIEIHGTKCKICKFDFKEKYGLHGQNYIEVHHKKPLHTLIEASEIDPEHDMEVLCANCHRMVHRKKHEPLSIEELLILWNRFNT